jgi:short-subunit dehydrogenase
MRAALDKRRFGPWALVTGASSGIGKEFARQIAAAGINLVLVARREALLQEVGRSIAADFKVDYRALAMDLSQEGFIERLSRDTNDLDIGLVCLTPAFTAASMAATFCAPRFPGAGSRVGMMSRRSRPGKRRRGWTRAC